MLITFPVDAGHARQADCPEWWKEQEEDGKCECMWQRFSHILIMLTNNTLVLLPPCSGIMPCDVDLTAPACVDGSDNTIADKVWLMLHELSQ